MTMFAIRNGKGKYPGVDGYAHAELETHGRIHTVVDGSTLFHRLSWWVKDNSEFRSDIEIVAVERATGWREVA